MQVSKQGTLVVVLGPTGVGKTETSLQMAEMLGCEIVSSDSRQFYRELKIGTAAPTKEELERVRHHFIGSHSIHDDYNAGQYAQEAVELINGLLKHHGSALLVGGSMMYIDAVCNGMDDIPTVDAQTRQFWKEQYEQYGLQFIQDELLRLDPIHYQQVDLQNHKRILHALEICSMTGTPYSTLRTGLRSERPFHILKIGFNRDRAELYQRINSRVLKMMESGLLDEARKYFEFRHLNTLNTVGYKELYEYMEGKYSLDFAVQMIQQDSRRYAKRQMTWFNRDKEIHWFHPDDAQKVLQFVKSNIL